MNLVTPYGRYDRAAIIARAKELHSQMEWQAAMQKAFREAAEELRTKFNRHSTIKAQR